MSNEEKNSDIPDKGSQQHHPSKELPERKYYYSGMLPLSSEFEAYDKAVLGTGKRIVDMTEKRENHRQSLQSKEQWLYHGGRFFSQFIVFAISIFALWIGKDLIEAGHSAWGIATILGVLVSFAGIVIWGKFKEGDK